MDYVQVAGKFGIAFDACDSQFMGLIPAGTYMHAQV